MEIDVAFLFTLNIIVRWKASETPSVYFRKQPELEKPQEKDTEAEDHCYADIKDA